MAESQATRDRKARQSPKLCYNPALAAKDTFIGYYSKYIRMQEAAELVRVSYGTMKRWVSAKRFNVMRLGIRIFIHTESFFDFLEEQAKKNHFPTVEEYIYAVDSLKPDYVRKDGGEIKR